MKPQFLIFIFCLIGCGSMSDITESLKIEKQADLKLQTSDKGANSYSGDPVDNISITASGNADVHLTVGDKGKVSKNEKRDTASEEEIEQSFSVDYYLRSIPTTGWALILLAIMGILIIVWIYFKTTATGKALDAGVGKALELTGDSIDIVRDKLADAQKGSDLHSDLQKELERLRRVEGQYLQQQKARARR